MNRNLFFDGFSGIKQDFLSKAQTPIKSLRTALDTQMFSTSKRPRRKKYYSTKYYATLKEISMTVHVKLGSSLKNLEFNVSLSFAHEY